MPKRRSLLLPGGLHWQFGSIRENNHTWHFRNPSSLVKMARNGVSPSHPSGITMCTWVHLVDGIFQKEIATFPHLQLVHVDETISITWAVAIGRVQNYLPLNGICVASQRHTSNE